MSPLPSLPGRPAHPYVRHEFDDQIEMVRPSAARYAPPPMPHGYELRQFHSGDEIAYDDLFHLAWRGDCPLAAILDMALGDGFFVVEHTDSGNLLASCVALKGVTSPHHAKGAGELGWLVTDPSHTRKGLASIVSASVANLLADKGYPRPYLRTEDFRLAAISLYIKQGWRPFVYNDGMETRWHSIFAKMGREFSPSIAVWPAS